MRNDVVAVNFWNAQIRRAVDEENPRRALFFFRKLKQETTETNHLTFPSISKACAKLSDRRHAQVTHAQIIKSPFHHDLYVQTAMVDMYAKCGELGIARKLFAKMPERDAASWNAMLAGFCQSGDFETVIDLFQKMMRAGSSPDSITIMIVCRAVSVNLEFTRIVHALGLRIGINSNVQVANTWISAYAKCGKFLQATTVLDEIDVNLRTAVSWNALIAGFANFGKLSDALNSYKQMLHHDFMPDASTILSLLSCCVVPDVLIQGMMIHSHAVSRGCNSDMQVMNTLISMYSKCGKIDYARSLFDAMNERTRVSWTAMISGYAEDGNVMEAITLFNDMEEAGVKSDLVTVLAVISSCCHSSALEIGRWIHAYASSNGFQQNLIISNALMDMYLKCGSVEDARHCFREMGNRTVVSWTTMIAGYALNGLCAEALNLFHEMVKLETRPNQITFLAVLQACAHAGFWDEGWDYFNKMTTVYHIHPELDHYACMADLLGRSGKLEEALLFIQNMPMEPDSAVWAVLLGACRSHHNVEIGEYAAHQLSKVDPRWPALYVETANIYASVGKWDGDEEAISKGPNFSTR